MRRAGECGLPSRNPQLIPEWWREVIPPERIVQTFEPGWTAGRSDVETITFEDLARTKLTTTLSFDTTEERATTC
jgi:hypothetical protein